MSDIDFISLQTFVTVCEKRSLTLAARLLGTTQSAVSQRLSKLEATVGRVLLDRRLRPIGPTPAGQMMLERAHVILTEVSLLDHRFADRSDFSFPELRLGVADTLGTMLVPSLVSEFRESVDRLVVRIGGSHDLGALLLQRELHVVISSDPIPDRSDLDRYELYREPLVLVLPGKTFAQTQDAELALANVAATLPFIRYSRVSPLATKIEAHLRRIGLYPPRRLEFNESESILELVRDGLGWTITTPVCLLRARFKLSEINVSLLPPGIYRSFTMMSRHHELGQMPLRLIKHSADMVNQKVIAPICEQLPWLSTKLSVWPIAKQSAARKH